MTSSFLKLKNESRSWKPVVLHYVISSLHSTSHPFIAVEAASAKCSCAIEVGELLHRHFERLGSSEAVLTSDQGLHFQDDSSSESDDSGLESLIHGHEETS